MTIDLEVKGLIELQKKNEKMITDLVGPPMTQAMRDNTLDVMRGARINAPIDTGRLRASITPVIRPFSGDTIQGVVGTNVEYAPFQELGTRFLRARRYMQRAIEEASDRIKRRFERAVKFLVEKRPG
jgi:hypothetical protein